MTFKEPSIRKVCNRENVQVKKHGPLLQKGLDITDIKNHGVELSVLDKISRLKYIIIEKKIVIIFHMLRK